mmetsp:Transcript_10646/g.30411  ORF Transcript_10646/g.30411 Transcript_10646/m.30411 type:complete len:328 (+) Transcript_10646:861-1844(+)
MLAVTIEPGCSGLLIRKESILFIVVRHHKSSIQQSNALALHLFSRGIAGRILHDPSAALRRNYHLASHLAIGHQDVVDLLAGVDVLHQLERAVGGIVLEEATASTVHPLHHARCVLLPISRPDVVPDDLHLLDVLQQQLVADVLALDLAPADDDIEQSPAIRGGVLVHTVQPVGSRVGSRDAPLGHFGLRVVDDLLELRLVLLGVVELLVFGAALVGRRVAADAFDADAVGAVVVDEVARLHLFARCVQLAVLSGAALASFLLGELIFGLEVGVAVGGAALVVGVIGEHALHDLLAEVVVCLREGDECEVVDLHCDVWLSGEVSWNR